METIGPTTTFVLSYICTSSKFALVLGVLGDLGVRSVVGPKIPFPTLFYILIIKECLSA
jgi:hypothetical protein